MSIEKGMSPKNIPESNEGSPLTLGKEIQYYGVLYTITQTINQKDKKAFVLSPVSGKGTALEVPKSELQEYHTAVLKGEIDASLPIKVAEKAKKEAVTTEKNVICPHCGKEQPQTKAMFCGFCGEKMSSIKNILPNTAELPEVNINIKNVLDEYDDGNKLERVLDEEEEAKEAENTKMVAEVENLDDLLRALDQIGEIQGGQKTYTPAEIKAQIRTLAQEWTALTQAEQKSKLNHITKKYGLRQKVYELLESENNALAQEINTLNTTREKLPGSPYHKLVEKLKALGINKKLESVDFKQYPQETLKKAREALLDCFFYTQGYKKELEIYFTRINEALIQRGTIVIDREGKYEVIIDNGTNYTLENFKTPGKTITLTKDQLESLLKNNEIKIIPNDSDTENLHIFDRVKLNTLIHIPIGGAVDTFKIIKMPDHSDAGNKIEYELTIEEGRYTQGTWTAKQFFEILKNPNIVIQNSPDIAATNPENISGSKSTEIPKAPLPRLKIEKTTFAPLEENPPKLEKVTPKVETKLPENVIKTIQQEIEHRQYTTSFGDNDVYELQQLKRLQSKPFDYFLYQSYLYNKELERVQNPAVQFNPESLKEEHVQDLTTKVQKYEETLNALDATTGGKIHKAYIQLKELSDKMVDLEDSFAGLGLARFYHPYKYFISLPSQYNKTKESIKVMEQQLASVIKNSMDSANRPKFDGFPSKVDQERHDAFLSKTFGVKKEDKKAETEKTTAKGETKMTNTELLAQKKKEREETRREIAELKALILSLPDDEPKKS